ncbi:hypothetical protein [Glycomyces rhizosphaerae]|uniref:Uncharacterized protein n=1 Tax=Glycomyces rhizosphaerae TaxID=2054422 RepID=A0ABV7PTX9_9ACTN
MEVQTTVALTTGAFTVLGVVLGTLGAAANTHLNAKLQTRLKEHEIRAAHEQDLREAERALHREQSELVAEVVAAAEWLHQTPEE